MRLITQSLLPLALAGSLSAGGVWNKRPFTEWSPEDVTRVLVASPWGQTESVSLNFEEAGPERPVTWKELGVPGSGTQPTYDGGSPVGGIGKPKSKDEIQVDINVRWSSALPIRQATALYKYGRSKLESPEARQLLAGEQKFYVIEISGVPAAVAFRGLEEMQGDLYANARLLTVSGRGLKPESAFVTARGAGLLISVRFSREKPLTLKDKQVEFVAESGILKIRRKYKLKEMVYNGKLEL